MVLEIAENPDKLLKLILQTSFENPRISRDPLFNGFAQEWHGRDKSLCDAKNEGRGVVSLRVRSDEEKRGHKTPIFLA